MSTPQIQQSVILSCTPFDAYSAWMDSTLHSAMLGDGDAKIDNRVGGEFSVWGDSVTGKTISLDPKKFKIVQEWRYEYDDWPKEKMSTITLTFNPAGQGKTDLQFEQIGVPEKYKEEILQGWKDYYWKPMQSYFSHKD